MLEHDSRVHYCVQTKLRYPKPYGHGPKMDRAGVMVVIVDLDGIIGEIWILNIFMLDEDLLRPMCGTEL